VSERDNDNDGVDVDVDDNGPRVRWQARRGRQAGSAQRRRGEGKAQHRGLFGPKVVPKAGRRGAAAQPLFSGGPAIQNENRSTLWSMIQSGPLYSMYM
jgi:hypothetical protein